MTRSTIAARSGKRISGRPFKKLPVTVLQLRWALVRRLVFAVFVGLFFAQVIRAFNADASPPEASAIMLGSLVAAFALLGAVTWRLGCRRRAAFEASGGDPRAASVLMFGVMAPRRAKTGSGGFQSDGGSASSGGGDGGDGCDSGGSGDGGGGDGGGGDGGGCD